jgi:myosin heavy subunit
LSTLTKILVVLVSFSVFWLCASVVTYVANADNYRQKYDELKADRDSLSKKVSDLTKQVNEKKTQNEQLEDKLNTDVASLKTQIKELTDNLNNAEREKAALLQKVNSWTSIVENFTQTNDKQGQLLKNTLEELNRIQAEQIKERKEFNETSAALVEKMAIIESLETEKRRLLEEKADLQNKLDSFLRPAGKMAVTPAPVTPERDMARPASPMAENIALSGTVTAVDLKNSMASISLGKADGVKKGMKFHVVRGDEFICDILIIDVDAKEAVGVLDLVQQQPKVGDKASTNL